MDSNFLRECEALSLFLALEFNGLFKFYLSRNFFQFILVKVQLFIILIIIILTLIINIIIINFNIIIFFNLKDNLAGNLNKLFLLRLQRLDYGSSKLDLGYSIQEIDDDCLLRHADY